MIALTRCQRHPGQAAAARCPSCQQSFCRECVTEHYGRMLCLACLEAVERARSGHEDWTVAVVVAASAFLFCLVTLAFKIAEWLFLL
jgi:hypothetical protein